MFKVNTRREFLQAAIAAPTTTIWPEWMPRLAFAPEQTNPRGDVLVVLFLRGAADALNMVVPHGESNYYRLRPTIGIARPDDGRTAAARRAVDLDGFFGLHPSLAPLLPAWQEGHLGIIHACGAPDESRSHFKAMELMERGVEDETGPASGWIGRHLASYNTGNTSPLRAIGLGQMVPRSLYGSVPATAFQSIVDFHLNGDSNAARYMQRMLRSLYEGEGEVQTIGQETLGVLDLMVQLDPASYAPVRDVVYPDTPFGHSLRQIAMLVKAEAGLEVATVDVGDWDTHFGQGGSIGLMAGLLDNLGRGLAAFHADMFDHWNKVTVVVMSEFGRRVKENASLGTDHGHGSVMWLMGGNVAGGEVHGAWPGLEREQLFGPGDLAVTTDYRDVLAEVCSKRLNNRAIDQIFPDYIATMRGFLLNGSP